MARRSYEERARRAAQAEPEQAELASEEPTEEAPVESQQAESPPVAAAEPAPPGEVWVSVRARGQHGFWRCAIHWPHAETVRLVTKEVAERLMNEPNLIVRLSHERPPSTSPEGD